MQISSEKFAELEEMAYQIRRLSVEMIAYSKWGHIGGSFSMAEILAVLYFQAMQVDPGNPKWEGRDRLILSKAHGSPALYAVLGLRGYYPLDRVYSYCELGGFEGHTDMTRTQGLESSGGPLGMGLSVAVGIGLGLRFSENPRARVYCILGRWRAQRGECVGSSHVCRPLPPRQPDRRRRLQQGDGEGLCLGPDEHRAAAG